MNFDVTWRHFYSPIPDVDSLPDETWTSEASLEGIAWEPASQIILLDRMGPAMDAFLGQLPPTPFRLPNGAYEAAESAFLGAMLRDLRPRRIVELGAGFSTLVIAAPAAANSQEGAEGTFVSVDPFPSPLLQPEPAGLTSLRTATAQQAALELSSELEAGDVLFVDTTHVAKVGSDVNYVFHEVLPRLSSGVIVHVHDVFLPWQYPETWIRDIGYYWSEQYVLQAFLVFNNAFSVLAGLHWPFRTERERFPEWVREAPAPSAF